MRLTYFGTATLLVELGGVRLLTDPVFDPAGTTHVFAPTFQSTKTYATAAAAGDLPDVDAVLLSHDQHGDNLDAAGRAVLSRAPRVVTTEAAAKRLARRSGARGELVGLAPFAETTVTRGSSSVTVVAAPARHGPPLSLPLVGCVVGFVVRAAGRTLYITGDTVLFRGVHEVAARFDVDVVVAHLGAAHYGPFRFTMNAAEAVALASLFPRARIVPVHYEGWTHFRETRADVDRAFSSAPAGASLAERLVWLEPGIARELA